MQVSKQCEFQGISRRVYDMTPHAPANQLSGHPESNQGPSDICNVYNQMLYQLSHSQLAILANPWSRSPAKNLAAQLRLQWQSALFVHKA